MYGVINKRVAQGAVGGHLGVDGEWVRNGPAPVDLC